jgi:hypothetical protein
VQEQREALRAERHAGHHRHRNETRDIGQREERPVAREEGVQ